MDKTNGEFVGLSSNGRIAKNTLLLYLRMLIVMCVGLFTSRVVLSTLGIDDYGIYNVVGGLVALFGFLNESMASGTSRFLTYSLAKNDGKETNRVFCTSMLIHALVAVVLIVLSETVGLWFLYEKLVFPPERLTAALWVYQCTVFSVCVMVLCVPYNSLIIAHERMSVFAAISVGEALLRLLIVYMLWLGDVDKLVLYGILSATVQLLLSSCQVIYCHRHFKLRLRLLWDRPLFMSMTRFSFWSLNGSFALLCCTQGLNILLNMFFGPAVNAARGVAVAVQSKMMSFCYNFQMAVNPSITKSYASGEKERMHHLVAASSKFSFFLLLLVSIPVLLNLSQLLEIWLGTVPDFTREFVVIMIFSSMVRLQAAPLITAAYATGNIRKFQLWGGTTLLLVLPVTYLLLRYAHISAVWTMAAYLIGDTMAHVFRICIILPMIGMRITDYIRTVLRPIFLATAFAVLPLVTIRQLFFQEISLRSLILSVLLSLVITCLSCFFVGCGRRERKAIMRHAANFMGRRRRSTP